MESGYSMGLSCHSAHLFIDFEVVRPLDAYEGYVIGESLESYPSSIENHPDKSSDDTALMFLMDLLRTLSFLLIPFRYETVAWPFEARWSCRR